MTTEELAAAWTRRFGAEATAEESFGMLTVDVSPAMWVAALTFARDDLGCGYFDWLTAVDEWDTTDSTAEAATAAETGSEPEAETVPEPDAEPDAATEEATEAVMRRFAIVAHLWSLRRRLHLLLRTHLPPGEPRLATATSVFRGARWHERETHEMFGVVFEGHRDLAPLLLPDGFEGHPLRKDFVLASRVAKPWPGEKEPGEGGRGGSTRRRRMRPPGVPEDWGNQAGGDG